MGDIYECRLCYRRTGANDRFFRSVRAVVGHIENHPDHEGERGLPYKRKIKDTSFDPDNRGSEGDGEVPVPDEKPQIEDYESVEEYARAYERWREAQAEGSDAGGSEDGSGGSGESGATLADVLDGE